MKRQADELSETYGKALRDYFEKADEASLHAAYELGRRALSEGLGVLKVVDLHHEALIEVLPRVITTETSAEVIRKSGEFLAESMSPFEITHRAYGEANNALRRLNDALEDETRRIAHELHDEAGQLLAAVHIRVDEIARGLPPKIRERFKGMRELLDRIEDQLRRLSHELRPTILDDLGLVPALEFLAEGITKRAKLRITVEGFKGPRLPLSIESALYRVVQESLNNVAKHARATQVWIGLRRQDGFVYCSIKDNGVGFDPTAVIQAANGRGLGLLGIRERLNALGGAYVINSAPGYGTELKITVPVEV